MNNDTFERDDCGAFVYPNGFKFPLEDTGYIIEACGDFHGGQGSALYKLQSSGHAIPSVVVAASAELEEGVRDWENGLPDPEVMCPMEDDPDKMGEEIATAWQAVEDLNRWAAGAIGCIEGDE